MFANPALGLVSYTIFKAYAKSVLPIQKNIGSFHGRKPGIRTMECD
jgi:hypothetical protein